MTSDPQGALFCTVLGRTGMLSHRLMSQQDVVSRSRRRAASASNPHRHQSFRATGIIEYLRSGDMVEVARQMANHESARTTGLYDWSNDQISLDEVERVVI